jgi:glyoxylase-like metal-dependent hydrolase (beta-lactamase superfamily II)
VATVDILTVGYVGERVAGTVSLIRDEHVVAVVDPGMVSSRWTILDPLSEHGVTPEDVTDVIISHHHPDHTWHIALFPNIRLHDYWATYERDMWTSRPAEGLELSDSIRLLETPGHTREDITTMVETEAGTLAMTHLWWNANSAGDPRAFDVDQLNHHRGRVLKEATIIIPGHGPAFPAINAPT